MNSFKSERDEVRIANELFDQGKFEAAFQKYLPEAIAGSVTAQIMIGWMYHSGSGVNQNLEEAERWYKKAAETNSPEGQFYLGTLYRSKGKYLQAIEWLEKAADQKYAPALYRLGKMYDNGEGANKNHDKAYGYFEEAAKMGHVFAQREVAVKMIKGHHGVLNILKGFFMFVKLVFAGAILVSKDPDSDLLRK